MLHSYDDGGAPASACNEPGQWRGDPLPRCAARRVALTLGVLIAASGTALATVVGDPRDQPLVAFAVNQALELERSGVAVAWSNPETGRKGTIVLEPATYAAPDKPCRSYRRTIEQSGFTAAEIRGNGCRIGAALWTVEETVLKEAAAVAPAPPPVPTTTPASTRKSERTRSAPDKPDAGAPAAASKPTLPAYTLPSKAGS